MSKKLSDQEIAAQFNAMKQELQTMAQKIGELEMESEEHKLVIDTIEPMNSDRKCFRLIGGVLVERTVEEILPAVKANNEGIKTIMHQLLEQYKKKEEAFRAFQKEHDIVVRQ